MSYSKLHSSIVASSLWGEKDCARILFITLLAMCDRDGLVYGSKSGISRMAMLSPDVVEEAWDILLSPDPMSSDRLRAPENNGRRIEEVPGGFKLLNFLYYRGLRNDDDRREQNRISQLKFKSKSTISQGKPRSAKVSRDKPASAKLSQGKPISEADADAEAVKKEKKKKKAKIANPEVIFPAALNFPEFWEKWAEYQDYRKASKFKSQQTKYQNTKLQELSVLGRVEAIKAIDQSMSNGYQGIFPAKRNNKKNGVMHFKGDAERKYDFSHVQEVKHDE